MGVTFHRAFDMTSDLSRSLEDVITLGVERVLTSGAARSAREAADTIRSLVEQAGERIVVMPGAGIRADNIVEVATATGAREFHASAKRDLPSGMHGMHTVLSDMTAGETRSDAKEVQALMAALQSLG
jgi:copper homeostasis protein